MLVLWSEKSVGDWKGSLEHTGWWWSIKVNMGYVACCSTGFSVLEHADKVNIINVSKKGEKAACILHPSSETFLFPIDKDYCKEIQPGKFRVVEPSSSGFICKILPHLWFRECFGRWGRKEFMSQKNSLWDGVFW